MGCNDSISIDQVDKVILRAKIPSTPYIDYRINQGAWNRLLYATTYDQKLVEGDPFQIVKYQYPNEPVQYKEGDQAICTPIYDPSKLYLVTVEAFKQNGLCGLSHDLVKVQATHYCYGDFYLYISNDEFYYNYGFGIKTYRLFTGSNFGSSMLPTNQFTYWIYSGCRPYYGNAFNEANSRFPPSIVNVTPISGNLTYKFQIFKNGILVLERISENCPTWTIESISSFTNFLSFYDCENVELTKISFGENDIADVVIQESSYGGWNAEIQVKEIDLAAIYTELGYPLLGLISLREEQGESAIAGRPVKYTAIILFYLPELIISTVLAVFSSRICSPLYPLVECEFIKCERCPSDTCAVVCGDVVCCYSVQSGDPILSIPVKNYCD